MRAGESNSLDALHVVDPLEKLGEIAPGLGRVLVVIHDLPEEVNLAVSLRRGAPGFLDDFGGRSHALMSSGVWNNTESAEVVTPLDDRYVRPYRVVSDCDAKRKGNVIVGMYINLMLRSTLSLLHKHWEALERLRADDDIYVRGSGEYLVPFLLSHASDDCHHGTASALGDAEVVESAVELVLRTVSHAARIDDDEIGIAWVGS
jgi:hypothetical protein